MPTSIDWTKSMQQTFAYYEVDPGTWKDKRRIEEIIECTIDRDGEAETLGSASFTMIRNIAECYVRVYLIATQNGLTQKEPLGTFLVESPSDTFDGKKHDISADGYTPLIELREKMPPLGYSILKGENILMTGYRLTRENVRAPVVEPACDDELFNDFISDGDESWISFLGDLIANAKHSYGLDEMGRVLFVPEQDTMSLSPVATYDDDNSSILYPKLTADVDLYSLPNVVEVYYSNNSGYFYSRAVNDDPNSLISTVSRGREVVYRETSPNLIGAAYQEQVDQYAQQLLRNLSSLECRITYSHGYRPVRLGDCIRLNYSRAGLTDIKAKVVSQSIKCTTGCTVTETAVFTKKLWG